MANENIGKSKEQMKDRDNFKKDDFKYLLKSKVARILFEIIIILVCSLIHIIYKSFKKKQETIPNIKNEIIREEREIPITEKKFLKKHNQELVEKLKDVNKKIYDFLSLTNYYNEYVDGEKIIEKVENLRKKYNNYLNIKRFAIPIIGTVGKSAFLNCIFELIDFYENEEEATTSKFLCIIRHNINYKTPVISNIKIEERDFLKYNFIK